MDNRHCWVIDTWEIYLEKYSYKRKWRIKNEWNWLLVQLRCDPPVLSSDSSSTPKKKKKKLACCHDKIGLSFPSGLNMGQNIQSDNINLF